MIRVIENGFLTTDLDCGAKNLNNVGQLLPLPSNLASSTDPRFTDQRTPLDSSVTNAKVSGTAAIVQSKLNLNGSIPVSWLGTTAGKAAEGNTVELVSRKGQANGYASLDATGKVPAGQMTTGAGTGTVTSVDLTAPSQFTVTGNPVTGSGTLALAWSSVPNLSWFGNVSGGSAAPIFQNTPFPVTLIPSLDVAKITTGVFPVARLPVALGVGGSHAPGLVPDPGASGTITDYLARDMTYKAIPTIATSYRPQLSAVVATPSTNVTGPRTVPLSPGDAYIVVTIFYSLSSAGGSATGPFKQYRITGDPTAIGYVTVPPLATVWFYSASQGYTDSTITSYANPNTV